MENELSDPANPLLLEDVDGTKVDTAEMLKGLMDVRGKLTGLSAGYVGGRRHDLVEKAVNAGRTIGDKSSSPATPERQTGSTKAAASSGESKTLKEMDHRVAELEQLIGSNNASMDEVRNS